MPQPYPLRRRLTPLVFVLIPFGFVGMFAYHMFHTSMPSKPNPQAGQTMEMQTKRGERYYARSEDVIFQYGGPLIVLGLLGAWIWYVNRVPYDPDGE
jgi:hypothetical protein